MAEHKDWPVFRAQCITDFNIFRRQENCQGAILEEHLLEWSLELYRNVMGSKNYPGGSQRLQEFLGNGLTRRSFLNDIGRIREAWKAENGYNGEITQDEVAEWSYAFIYGLNNQDKKELVADLSGTLSTKIDRSRMPGILKKQLKKAVRKQAGKFF